MTSRVVSTLLPVALVALPAMCQQPPPGESVPIYRITVVERTVKAINYQYRSGPTLVDFRGTVLMPKAKGLATVNSKQGRTEVDVGFSNLSVPQTFGREYLTYVLWALTPDGRPHNMGEIIPNGFDNSHLKVTTDLQAFAMIVTAEPYSAVRQPSDVVVMENQVRNDTTGIIEQVNARYELLPRGHYAWEPSDKDKVLADLKNSPKVSMREYEELIELYQAQNAIGAARSAGAAEYAQETLNKAETLLQQAQQRHARKADRTLAIQEAREAAQSAEDARLLAEQRKQQAKLAKAEADTNAALQAKAQADAARESAQLAVQQAESQAAAAQAQVAAEREARRRAEEQAEAAHSRAAQMQTSLDTERAQRAAAIAKVNADSDRQAHEAQQREARGRLLGQLNAVAATRDTGRGLVVTIPDSGWEGGALRPAFVEQITRVSRIVMGHPTLKIEVEGHSDRAEGDSISLRRAQTAGDTLTRQGLSSAVVSVRDYGNSRPIGPNAKENRRVEIVISGDEIGSMALWDRPYTLPKRTGG